MVVAVSNAAIALIVAGGFVVLALGLWLVAWWSAWAPDWLARWRHSVGEASWRTSATWAEFTDWLRLGR